MRPPSEGKNNFADAARSTVLVGKIEVSSTAGAAARLHTGSGLAISSVTTTHTSTVTRGSRRILTAVAARSTCCRIASTTPAAPAAIEVNLRR